MGQKKIHSVSDLAQPNITIPFGLHNQKIILKVYKKIKKIRNCIKNHIQKNRKKSSNRKIESDSSSEVITHIEIQKEIDTIHVIIHIGFPNL